MSMEHGEAPRRSDWALWPNRLTAGRIVAAALLPFVLLLLERPISEAIALGLFVAASITDFFDGWLARRWNQTSRLGAILDPLADKALVLATLLALGLTRHSGDLWFWLPAIVIALREIGVTWLRGRMRHAPALSVTLAAKWKTTFQMAAAATLLAAGPIGGALGFEAALVWIGGALLIIAAALSFATGLDYLRRAFPRR